MFGTIARQPDTISKVLYSNKCYRSLKHFVPLLTEFQQLGCAVPCDLKRLQAFADLDNRRSRVSQQKLVLVNINGLSQQLVNDKSTISEQ